MTVRVVFPCNNGGNWLDDVLWHLEHNDTTLTQPRNQVFDSARNSSIRFYHSFDILKDGTIKYSPGAEVTVLFSTPSVFNIYVNHANKYLYLKTPIGTKTSVQQLFELSNCARYHLSDTHFASHYCENIDLHSDLLVQDPDQFVSQLFLVLDRIGFKYTANTEYVLASIENYVATCENVNHIIGNWDNLKWLAACHAVTLLDSIEMPVIQPDFDIKKIAHCMKPHAKHCLQRLEPFIAKWKI